MRTLAIWIAGSVKGANVTFASNSVFTNSDGWCSISFPSTITSSILVVSAAGYKPYQQQVNLLPNTTDVSVGDTGQQSPDNILLPSLERLGLSIIRTEGPIFRDNTNSLWIVRGMDGFRDYDKYYHGEDITPQLSEAKELGFNQRRVFFCVNSFAKIDPKVPGFYDRIPDFLDLLASFGLYCELTGGDMQILIPDVNQQRTYLQNLVNAIGVRPAFIEGCNEGFKNGWHPEAWNGVNYPPNILTCNTSPGGDGNPPAPYREYVTLHPTRKKPKWQLAGQDGFWATYGWGVDFTGTGKPPVMNEPMGAGNVDTDARSTDAGAFYRLARDISTWCAGGTFHADDLIQSNLLSPTQRACAEAFANGLRS